MKKRLGKDVQDPSLEAAAAAKKPEDGAKKEEAKPKEKKERPPQPKVNHKFSDKNVVVLTQDTFDE